MKKYTVPFLLIIISVLLSACGGIKNETAKDAVRSFVQAGLDGDRETIEELYLNPEYTTDEIIIALNNNLRGTKAADLVLYSDEENEVSFVTEAGDEFEFEVDNFNGKYFITELK